MENADGFCSICKTEIFQVFKTKKYINPKGHVIIVKRIPYHRCQYCGDEIPYRNGLIIEDYVLKTIESHEVLFIYIVQQYQEAANEDIVTR
ncbi:YgiT-type zinc finger protein [Virgibacillus doumboii]|uniref:YgiT-type zinc finger protein n=1 Tax=Virgibacillus doumboii TaxID=2697503 RepID=UPI0013E0D1F7|nr:YgiT-type zinc finger protein [Virgibacillus doumboii]